MLTTARDELKDALRPTGIGRSWRGYILGSAEDDGRQVRERFREGRKGENQETESLS